MHEAIDGGGGGHRILEDAVPLAENEIARNHHALSFVTLGEEREEHLHLVAALLHVANVVEDDHVEAVERGEFALEAEISFRSEEALDEGERGREKNPVTALDELVTNRANHVGFASPGETEHEQVFGTLDERALAKRGHRLGHLWREARLVQPAFRT